MKLVDVLATMKQCQQGRDSPQKAVRNAAESVMSLLVVQLSHPQAVIPTKLQPHLDVLTAYTNTLGATQ